MTDDLAPLLDTVRVTTTLFGIADLPRDWGVEFPPGRGAYFHVVYGGDGWLHLDAAGPARVGSGDVVLLPRGSAHRITGTVDGTPKVLFDPVRWTPNVITMAARRDSTPSGMTLICAAVESRERTRPALLDLMPAVFQVPAGDPRAGQLDMAVTMLRMEAATRDAGRETVLARLGDALLVQLVRSWLQQGGGSGSWAAAFADRQIGPVLQAIHADLGAPWSLESMASIARLSRSRFAERFRDLLGVSPMTYLTQRRLDTARELLEQGRSVRSASRAVGYDSEQAFSRAFTRRHGVPPSRAAATAASHRRRAGDTERPRR